MLQSKSSHDALLLGEENQSCVPICSMVLPCIESKSIHDPKTLKNWFFNWNNLTTIKSILINEYCFVIYIKIILQSIFKFVPTAQICAKTLKLETPIFLFSQTHARGLLIVYVTRLFPPIFNRLNEALLRSTNYVTHL